MSKNIIKKSIFKKENIIIILIYIITFIIFQNIKMNKISNKAHSNIQGSLKKFKTEGLITDPEVTYLIAQGDTKFYYYCINYFIFPNKIKHGLYSIGPKRNKGDIWRSDKINSKKKYTDYLKKNNISKFLCFISDKFFNKITGLNLNTKANIVYLIKYDKKTNKFSILSEYKYNKSGYKP